MARFIKENDLGEVFDAPYDVYFDEEDVVQPDILYVSKERVALWVRRISKGLLT